MSVDEKKLFEAMGADEKFVETMTRGLNAMATSKWHNIVRNPKNKEEYVEVRGRCLLVPELLEYQAELEAINPKLGSENNVPLSVEENRKLQNIFSKYICMSLGVTEEKIKNVLETEWLKNIVFTLVIFYSRGSKKDIEDITKFRADE